MKRIIEKQI